MKVYFPLQERQLTRGAAEHISAGLGAAVDLQARYVDLFSPVDGKVYLFQESGGGLWIRVTDAEGRRWEMAHLFERSVRTGQSIRAGQRIGITGNSGTITTGPHLHLQLFTNNGSRLDPWPFLINAPFPMTETFDNCIIRLQEGEQSGSFAYVKAGTGQKQIITRERAGLAMITFVQRSNDGVHLKKQIKNVTQKEWDTFTTVPEGTWF